MKGKREDGTVQRKSKTMMKRHVMCLILLCGSNAWCDEPESPVEPREKVIRPFNGKDLSGFTTWLRKTDRNESETNYSVHDGTIHISGEGMGIWPRSIPIRIITSVSTTNGASEPTVRSTCGIQEFCSTRPGRTETHGESGWRRLNANSHKVAKAT